MSQASKLSRRSFLKRTFAAAALCTGASSLWTTLASAADDLAKKMVNAETDPSAKGLQYNPDASKSGGKGKGQTCSGCMHYTKAGKVGKDDVGSCVLFQGKMVNAQGWCMGWAKKPA